ncbi:MAG: 2-amino-4-hydroxy-6-hydroxymethyldihydropteridine diphosphokinase [Peptoniphilaceae bacterium]|nr:2-amino-4-hydroxy-6-hydroxymethyldihydropteridine diphosphokinase [Peptoniphilaceae bacterium]MDD7382973.1 2-amino-4-hydroxy-6-hydroxymethyldihydropteridine diphosphokinase [Peptoniphilaceae bacterium]MDY3737724.1 2-amino-4-hydroxy-6-hydroxymethyldihydropteridine diphosphokinase [Peptoniphilaceae bacterium]
MTDTIKIVDLEIFHNHGFFNEEKKMGQKFLISIELNLDNFLDDDNLENTISYADVADFTKEIFTEETFDLIETVADVLSLELLKKYKRANSVTVSIKKPYAPIKDVLKYPEVIKRRKREIAFLSLGTNMGDKEKNLNDAISFLKENENIDILKKSSYIETKPWGKVDQENFLNNVVEIETIYSPEELLKTINTIEKIMGRKRIEKWGPRIIDIDILFFGNEVIYTEDLKIPHPYIEDRNFVLDSLNEIAPFFVHPVLKKQIRKLI